MANVAPPPSRELEKKADVQNAEILCGAVTVVSLDGAVKKQTLKSRSAKMTVSVVKSCPENHLCNRKGVIQGKMSNKKTTLVYVLRPILAVCVP